MDSTKKDEKTTSAKILLPVRVSPVKVEPPISATSERQDIKVGSVVLVHNEKPLKGQPKFVPARVISPEKESVKVPKLTHSNTSIGRRGRERPRTEKRCRNPISDSMTILESNFYQPRNIN